MLRLFASARDIVGTDRVTIELPESFSSAAQLKACLLQLFPQLSAIDGSFVLALNAEYIASDNLIQLKSGDELAIIPPLSGG